MSYHRCSEPLKHGLCMTLNLHLQWDKLWACMYYLRLHHGDSIHIAAIQYIVCCSDCCVISQVRQNFNCYHQLLTEIIMTQVTDK